MLHVCKFLASESQTRTYWEHNTLECGCLYGRIFVIVYSTYSIFIAWFVELTADQ